MTWLDCCQYVFSVLSACWFVNERGAGVNFLIPDDSSSTFGPNNGDVGLRITGSSVTVSGSLSNIVNAAAAPLSVYKTSSASLSGLHFLNNQGGCTAMHAVAST